MPGREKESARESGEEGNSMNTVECSGGRARGKGKEHFSIGGETGFYTERAEKKKKRARVEKKERNKYTVKGRNQNGDSFCDSSILLQGNSPLNRQRFMYRGKILLWKNKRAVMSNVLRARKGGSR